MRLPIPSRDSGPWENTMLIGGTCKHSNVFSGPVLIARGLDLELATSLWSFEGVRACARRLDNFGGHSGGGTPLPIPNREVKPASADGTRRATSRESRSPPNYLQTKSPALAGLFHAMRNVLRPSRGPYCARARSPKPGQTNQTYVPDVRFMRRPRWIQR